MAAILVLDDGRKFFESSFGVQGMLLLVARELPDEHWRLRRWIADKAVRSAPFQDFDFRGLSEVHRGAFWEACRRAHDRLAAKYGDFSNLPENAFAASCINGMVEAHHKILAGDPPPVTDGDTSVDAFDGHAEDLDELWEASET
jgi:hypothetical protein